MKEAEIHAAAEKVVSQLSKRLNLIALDHCIKDRPDGPYLIIEVAKPNERLYRALNETLPEISEENPFKERVTLSSRKKNPPDRLGLPETQLLKAELSESLTVDRHTYTDNFLDRYIKSVFGYEDQIVTASNYIVYGRRGSGKSSLLAYAMHQCKQKSEPYVWIDMQVYSQMGRVEITLDILREIIGHLAKLSKSTNLKSLHEQLAEADPKELNGKNIHSQIPNIKRALAEVVKKFGNISIFLDDLHVINRSIQALVLSDLYAFCRGNRCYLKISGIEHFSRPWDVNQNIGLQAPHDAQVLKLDYNLTMPDKSRDHIKSILDAHAKFCGLPEISFIAGEGVLSRLVWVAAAVPRDALNLFGQAITKASAQGQKRVSITSVNAAASEMAEQKMRDLGQDLRGEKEKILSTLEDIKTFCINAKKKNAFLVEINSRGETYKNVQELIALRLVHVLHEGITPNEAGRRYQALLLDYGFYVGIRAAKSVDLFQRDPKTPSAKELRKLPILDGK
ncbi:MAG: ATP-binding protein [Planctomycetes bacterium]|nr:ATP-binding protein [Planctomycetota bacterium]